MDCDKHIMAISIIEHATKFVNNYPDTPHYKCIYCNGIGVYENIIEHKKTCISLVAEEVLNENY